MLENRKHRFYSQGKMTGCPLYKLSARKTHFFTWSFHLVMTLQRFIYRKKDNRILVAPFLKKRSRSKKGWEVLKQTLGSFLLESKWVFCKLL